MDDKSNRLDSVVILYHAFIEISPPLHLLDCQLSINISIELLVAERIFHFARLTLEKWGNYLQKLLKLFNVRRLSTVGDLGIETRAITFNMDRKH